MNIKGNNRNKQKLASLTSLKFTTLCGDASYINMSRPLAHVSDCRVPADCTTKRFRLGSASPRQHELTSKIRVDSRCFLTVWTWRLYQYASASQCRRACRYMTHRNATRCYHKSDESQSAAEAQTSWNRCPRRQSVSLALS